MTYFAHTKDGKTFTGEDECQELSEHLDNTARYATEKAAVFGAPEAGGILGLLHDIGKYDEDFQKHIRGKLHKKVPHAMAGARALNDTLGKIDKISRYYGIIIASHHTGLRDWGAASNMDSATYCGALNNCTGKSLPCVSEVSLPKKIVHKTIICSDNDRKHDGRYIGFKIATYLRMLFSVLVDSDFTDTEEFCTGIKRAPERIDADFLYGRLMGKMPKNDGGIVNGIRAEILKNCLSAAEKPRGLFSLTVPTGGGKTLSSLAFALRHAAIHGLRRIIYVIPYTSIIEQNAAVIREKLGDKNVFEHHSGITADGEDFRARWAAENWDTPVIVTTNVQFFESLFAAKTTKARKIHNIAKSIIIFDEVQTLPTGYLSPCIAIISELVENYGVTAVLCSATQPCFHRYTYKNIKAVEIADNPDNLFERLKRVVFRFAGKKTDDDIVSELKASRSALVVVNSRKHAFALFNSASEIPKENLFYLSTLLTPAHRSEKIKRIKERLRKNLPVTVISTQLIEAGVDVDFPVVYRSIAGIDSVIQAGGRANREGRLKNENGNPKLGEVIVFEPVGDNGKIPRALTVTAKTGKEIIDCLGDRAFGLEGINKYFELLYTTLERNGAMDKKGILDNFETDRHGEIVGMEFETAANAFKLIDDNTHGIVIGCPESEELIKSIRNGEYTNKTIRELQKHSVSVYQNEFIRLKGENAVIEIIAGINALVTERYYSEEKGLDIFTGDNKNGDCYCL